jgi:hypothetical protein
VRALAVVAEVDGAGELSATLAEAGEILPADFDPVGERMTGWYVQVGYDVLSVLRPGEASLSPFIRYEEFNTQDEVPAGFSASGKNDVTATTIGLNFKPIEEIVLKGEFQVLRQRRGQRRPTSGTSAWAIFSNATGKNAA